MFLAILIGCAIKTGIGIHQAELIYRQMRPVIEEKIPSHEEVMMQRNTMQAGAERLEQDAAELVYDWEMVELYMSKSREEYANAKYSDAEVFAGKAARLMQEIATEQEIPIEVSDTLSGLSNAPSKQAPASPDPSSEKPSTEESTESSGNIYADP